MPKYMYLGSGQTVTKTSKAGNQYLQRCVFLAPIKDDGSLAASTNVYLMGDNVGLPDSLGLLNGNIVFADFNHRGYLVDFRLVPKPDKQ